MLWGTPPHPPARAKPLQPISGFRRSDVFAHGRFWLVRIYARMEQEIPILNTYSSAWNTCGIAELCEVARWRLLANGEPDTIREWVSPQTGAERAAAVMGDTTL